MHFNRWKTEGESNRNYLIKKRKGCIYIYSQVSKITFQHWRYLATICYHRGHNKRFICGAGNALTRVYTYVFIYHRIYRPLLMQYAIWVPYGTPFVFSILFQFAMTTSTFLVKPWCRRFIYIKSGFHRLLKTAFATQPVFVIFVRRGTSQKVR